MNYLGYDGSIPLVDDFSADVRFFLRTYPEFVDALQSLARPIKEEFGEVKCRLEVDGIPGFEKLFVLVPFHGNADEAIAKVDAINAARRALSSNLRRLFFVDVEFA